MQSRFVISSVFCALSYGILNEITLILLTVGSDTNWRTVTWSWLCLCRSIIHCRRRLCAMNARWSAMNWNDDGCYNWPSSYRIRLSSTLSTYHIPFPFHCRTVHCWTVCWCGSETLIVIWRALRIVPFAWWQCTLAIINCQRSCANSARNDSMEHAW